MVQRNSEGVCQKIYNSVIPVRSTIRWISHLPRGSISVTRYHQNIDYPVKTSSPQTKPVHHLHQSKMIPIEFNSSAANSSDQENKTLMTFSPGIHSAGKENSNGQDSADGEIQIVKRHRFVKPASSKREAAQPEKAIPDSVPAEPNRVLFGQAKSKEEDEAVYSAYIAKVLDRMTRTA